MQPSDSKHARTRRLLLALPERHREITRLAKPGHHHRRSPPCCRPDAACGRHRRHCRQSGAASTAASMVRLMPRPLSALSSKREVVRQFTPSWFTVTMSTGIVGLLIGELQLFLSCCMAMGSFTHD